MDNLQNKKDRKKYGAILVVILLGMCYAALRPKGFHLRNDVTLLPSGDGLKIGPQGILFTEEMENVPILKESQVLKVTIELAFRSTFRDSESLASIFCFWNKKEHRVVSLCQWNEMIIFFGGTKFTSEGYRQVGVPITIGKKYLVTIIYSRQNGTAVFLNGKNVVFSPDFHPISGAQDFNRLAFGSFPSGRSNWDGEINAFQLSLSELTPEDVHEWFYYYRRTGLLEQKENTLLSYSFSEFSKNMVVNSAGRYGNLLLFEKFRVPEKEGFILPWNQPKYDISLLKDALVNILGFVPLGFFLAAFLKKLGGIYRYHLLLNSVLLCGCVSFSFELIQVFIPSRSSQVLDLILNVLGSFFGVVLYFKTSMKRLFG